MSIVDPGQAENIGSMAVGGSGTAAMSRPHSQPAGGSSLSGEQFGDLLKGGAEGGEAEAAGGLAELAPLLAL